MVVDSYSFLRFRHIFRARDVTVVLNTAVFVHLHSEVVVYRLHLVFITYIAGEYSGIEVRCGLVLVVSPSVQIVNVEAERQPLVDVYREIGLEAFFTVDLISCFIVGKIGERYITVGKFHFIGADEEAGEGLHEDGRLVVSAFKEDT